MAMNKNRKTSNIANIVTYDAFGNVVLPAGLRVQGLSSGYVVSDANGVLSIASAPTTNIYNSNGTLTSNRTVTMSGFTLSFSGDVYANGVRIGKGNGSFSSNTAFGENALISFSGTTLGNNTAIGLSALRNNTTGYQNTAVGSAAMVSTTTANSNVAVGCFSLYSNTTGGAATAVGAFALFSSNANYNVAVGSESLRLTTGANNTALGSIAGREISSGVNNTVIGYQAGRGITTGSYNTVIGGLLTGLSATLSNNVIIGDGQGNMRIVFNGSGDAVIGSTTYPTFFGFKLDVIGGDARVNGVRVGMGVGSIFSNTTVGLQSGANTTGSQNTSFGFRAIGSNTTGNNNTSVGVESLYLNSTGSNNTSVGVSSLYNATGSNNTSFGYFNGYDITTGTGNTIIGYNAGRGITTGSNNTIIGGSITGLSSSLSSNVIIANGLGTYVFRDDNSNTFIPRLSGSGTRMVTVGSTGALGFADIPVPTARTLTINGTTYDLSANRSWTISTGSGTVTSVGLTAGTGISVSGGPITSSGSISVTNTAPDQVVTLTNGGGMSITGTYPNFTLTATASVSGTPYYVPVFNGSGTGLTNSLIYDDTAHILIGTTSSSGSLFEASTTLTNDIATFSGVEPYIWIKALGASNGAALFFAPSSGVNGSIHNRTGGGIETYVGATPSIKHVVKASGQIQFNGYTSTSSFSGTVSGYLGFDSSGNIITTAGVGGIILTTTGSSGAATWDGTTLNIPIYSGGGGGSVTTVSVVSANGFSGTVSNAASTPAITLTTTVNGILKGNSTSISAASAGLDYQAPITLTTTGSSGAATFIGNTLNIPNYGLISGVNIYGSDGTLTGNRVVSSGGFTLTFEPLTYFLDNISVSKNQNNPTSITFTNTTSALQSRIGVAMVSDGLSGSAYLYKYSSGATGGTGYSIQNDLVLVNNTAGNIVISNLFGGINFFTGGANQYMTLTSAGKLLLGTTSAGGSKLRISGLPTSSAGLSSGDVWSNGGVLTIVP